MNDIVTEAKNLIPLLDTAADEALKKAKGIVMMDVDMEHPQCHRLLAVQVEAAKLILATKFRHAPEQDDNSEVMAKLMESFKIEYKQTATIVSHRPETIPLKAVNELPQPTKQQQKVPKKSLEQAG
jgi:hypothetical protein